MIDLEKIRREKPIKELLNFSIINIDKPSGPTSFYVSHYVGKQVKASKAAHFGTLDPAVSGILPVALNKACRLNEYLMHRNKTYVGIMRLHADVSDEELKKIITKFTGKIKQLPPLRSRVKRQIREREVISFTVFEREDKNILFETEVQAGTYIRKLCDDMGKELGGAHMLELRRVKAGLFSEPSISLYDFDKAVEAYKQGDETLLRQILIPGEIVSTLLPCVEVKREIIKQLLQGKPLFNKDLINKIPEDATYIAVFHDQKFIEIAKVLSEGNIIARPEFVFV